MSLSTTAAGGRSDVIVGVCRSLGHSCIGRWRSCVVIGAFIYSHLFSPTIVGHDFRTVGKLGTILTTYCPDLFDQTIGE